MSEDDFIKENKRTKLSYGDILLTIVGTIGRSAIYKKQYENIIFQRSVAVLSPNKKFVNSEYLNAYIQTDFIQNVLQNKAHGVAQLGIYLKDLRKVEVLCPPLSKQEEFADKVEQINKYIAAQQEELEQFETLFQSLLQEAFTGVLTWNYPRKECHDKKINSDQQKASIIPNDFLEAADYKYRTEGVSYEYSLYEYAQKYKKIKLSKEQELSFHRLIKRVEERLLPEQRRTNAINAQMMHEIVRAIGRKNTLQI